MFYEVANYYNYNDDDDVGKLWRRKSKWPEEDQIANCEADPRNNPDSQVQYKYTMKLNKVHKS